MGGAAFRLQTILESELGYKYVRFQKGSLDLGFPAGRKLNQAEIEHEAESSDVIHYHTAAVALTWHPVLFKKFPKKKYCLTAHGIESLGEISKRTLALGIPVVAVTPNILVNYPNATFLPNAIHPTEEGYLPPKWPKPATLICSRSYVAAYKDHDIRDQVASEAGVQLIHEGRFLPNKTWINRHVREAMFVWDHFQGYWGQTTIEGWWCGTIPVVLPNDDARARARECWGIDPPFGPTTKDEWVSTIRRCASDPNFAAEMISARFNFVSEHWTPSICAARWRKFYESIE